MRSPSVLIGWLLLVALLPVRAANGADASTGSALPSIAAQPNAATVQMIPAPQPTGSTTRVVPVPQSDDARTLEIGRQQPLRRVTPYWKDLRNLNLRSPDDHRHHPYLGIDLEVTAQCYMGKEENGLEVVNVYPNSPAARAGLIARTESTPMGDLSALGSVLLGPVALVTFPILRKSGALGMGGDLIVAVDDVRVRNKSEMLSALGKLKPGDTTYITVIRPLRGGYHQTMRIALHIDYETDAAGNRIPSAADAPGARPTASTETAAD